MKINSDPWRQTVIDGALAAGVMVSAGQALTMGHHARELILWNRTTNLTAITDPMEVAVKHYVDALAAIPQIGDGLRVLDAGSGGGFPGIPLKIVRPGLSVTLVDSVRKKVSFLKHAIRTLELNGIHAVHGRLEDLGLTASCHRRFDLVVCRAFSSLEDFVKVALGFLAPGGRLLAMKGPQAEHDHETADIEDDGTIVLCGRRFSITIDRYRLPLLDDRRRLVWLAPVSDDG